MFLFDAHLDLSMNALDWNRDLSKPLLHIRERERGQTDKPDRSKGVVSFEEMRRGHIGMCVATQIARYIDPVNPLPGWHSPAQAWAQTQGQLAWYRAMEAQGELRQITTLAELHAHLALWEDTEDPSQLPIGYILSLEGADSLLSLEHLDYAYAYGLRAIGPAHYGPGVYAHGTDASAPLNARGRELLVAMEKKNMILDATHLCDLAFWEAMSFYQGPVWASHNLVRALVPHNRQFSDEMLRELIGRGAVIGMAFDAWMMVPNWIRGATTPQQVGLIIEHIVAHIDHICQLAGSSAHVGIGSDLDGGFGTEQAPMDLTSIADLQKIPELLDAKGYTASDIEGIMWRNWVRFLEKAWGV